MNNSHEMDTHMLPLLVIIVFVWCMEEYHLVRACVAYRKGIERH